MYFPKEQTSEDIWMETGVGLLSYTEWTSASHSTSYSHKFLVPRHMFLPLCSHPLGDQDLHVKYIRYQYFMGWHAGGKTLYCFQSSFGDRVYRATECCSLYTD